jgi:3-phenylpropionate/trans-cinnamate dioxygenase ferredoxin reductase subunit
LGETLATSTFAIHSSQKMTNKSLVIVGASYAGVQMAASARELGFEEEIVIIGDEKHAPYQRPPLSKGLLAGKTTVDKLGLRGPDFFTQNRIDLRLGQRAAAFDAGARTVTLASGDTLDYGWLLLATGARCRPLTLPGRELAGVHDLRTLDDALAVAAAADRCQRACIIGGGFIGLEVASALRTRGAEVTVIEAQPHLLSRTFPPAMSAFVENAHRSRGIDLRTGHGVKALHGTAGQLSAVELNDGSRIECDLVVLGIGVLPNSEIATAAGLVVDNGIVADLCGRTSAAQVLSVGDVARVTQADGLQLRLESIQAANDGARAAAGLLVGKETPNTALPWFWSDQFDLKIQMAGLHAPQDQVVVRGDMASEKFSVFYLRGGVLVATHAVNKASEHMLARRLITAQTSASAEQLADESFDLKSLLAPVA